MGTWYGAACRRAGKLWRGQGGGGPAVQVQAGTNATPLGLLEPGPVTSGRLAVVPIQSAKPCNKVLVNCRGSVV